MITVIIPAFNEENNVFNIFARIDSLLKKNNIENEIIFVDDGSKDKTFSKIKSIAELNINVTGIQLSRNFGKEAAISAGLSVSTGECAVVIDCDLQHPPEKILEMYSLWEDGYEIVEGIKRYRGDNRFLQNFASKFFYTIMSKILRYNFSGSSDFMLLDRKVIDTLNKMQEKDFFRGISCWVGYNRTTVLFDVQKRAVGKSKWSFFSLMKYAISNITSYTTAPMQAVTVFGFIFMAFSIISGVKAVFAKTSHYITMIITAISFVGSIIMISLGIIGYYIARIFEIVKGRPKYIISSVTKKEQRP